MKQDNSQLELFSHANGPSEMNRPLNNSFINFIRGYERALVAIICIIFTGIISFALGVEKGRRLESSLQPPIVSAVTTASSTQTLPAQDIKYLKNIPERNVKPGPVEERKANIAGFTIQLASYRTKTFAQREADTLKKRGLAPLVLAKGIYTVLCVGNFTDKQTAQPLLSELKKRYQGCYLRRL